MYRKIIEKLKNKNIAILGFGREGQSTYRFIRKYLSNPITIIDKKDLRDDLAPELVLNNVEFISGANYLEGLEKYDLVIKTPGISLADIDTSHINITSQMELVLESFEGLSIGITGTKGKSTTTSLIYEILKKQKDHVYLAGNIGIPIIDKVEEYTKDTILVMEMSSHQLEFLKVSPHLALITNLYQDHLDHDKTVLKYHQNKLNIFKYQKNTDYSLYNLDNEYLVNYLTTNHYEGQLVSISNQTNKASVHLENGKYYYDQKFLYDPSTPRKLIGEYNIFNIVLALTVSQILKLDMTEARKVVQTFEQVDYRMMLVGEYNHVKYYSDTLATIPVATISGIEGLKNVNTLIFGGMDRGIDYEEFTTYLNNCSVKHLICMPTTGYSIGKKLTNKDVHFCQTLQEATILATQITEENSICLLSPAASSYEQFKNYEEKADKFKEYLEEIYQKPR